MIAHGIKESHPETSSPGEAGASLLENRKGANFPSPLIRT